MGNSPHSAKIFRMQKKKKKKIVMMIACKVGSHAGICLEGWKFYLFYFNISFYLCFLWSKTKIFLS